MGKTGQKQEHYEGDLMDHCPLYPFDLVQVRAVVVTGAVWNPCGHMLLNTHTGWYFHVAGIHGRPKFMREDGYFRYLRETGKTEIRRHFITIPNPEGSLRELKKLLAKPWTWWVLPNNCASFVEDVVRAGGSKAGLYSNCPAGERFR